MKKKYFVNTNRGTIHLTNSKDGRCKIKMITEEQRAYYDTLEEALQFPNSDNPKSKPCTFCLRNGREGLK